MAHAEDQTYTIPDLAQMQIAHSGNWYQQQAMKSLLLTEAPLTEAQAAELERRLVEYKKNPEAGASWEEVKERILKRS